MDNFKDVPTEQLLSFQEFTPVHQASFASAELNIESTKQDPKGFDDFTSTNIDNNNPLDDSNELNNKVKSFWSLEFYQSLFDVDTNDVLERIFASFVPKRDSSFRNKIKSKPDLYGPIWISITLVFALAISGNVSKYLSLNTKEHWKYNFHLVSYVATAIYIYIGIIPIALWGLLKWSSTNSEADEMELQDNPSPKLLELLCIYGYSIFIYIPTSILWSIQIQWVQWTLVIAAALLSGFVLLYTLMPALRRSTHKIILITSILVFHFLLAAGFMLYCFQKHSD